MHGTGTCNLALPSVSGCGGSLTRAHSSSHSNGPIGIPPTIRPHFSHCAVSPSAMFGFSHVCLYVRFSSSCPGGPWHCDVVPAWLPGPACVGWISSSAVGWISSSTISPVARALLGRFGAGSYALRNPERIAPLARVLLGLFGAGSYTLRNPGRIAPLARALLGLFGACSFTLRNPERIAAVRINQNGFSCFT